MTVMIVKKNYDEWYRFYQNAMFQVELENDTFYRIIVDNKFKGRLINKEDCQILVEPEELNPYKLFSKNLKDLIIKSKELNLDVEKQLNEVLNNIETIINKKLKTLT
jgi:hypothetical protein